MGGDTMTCQFDEMLLYEYLDDLLDPKEKVEVSNHLSSCGACRKKVAEMKLLFYELDHLEPVVVPDEVALIRAEVVENSFDEKQSVYSTMTDHLKKTKDKLNNTPVIGTLMPTTEKLSTASKLLYKGTKKVVGIIPKKEKKPEKKPKKKLIKNFGGLL